MNTKIKQSFTSLKQLFTTPEPVNPLEKPSLFKKYKYLLLAFFVPFILMFFAYGIQKFYFFHLWDTLPDWIENILYKLGLISSVNTDVAGTNQIMVIDMWHQYFQFFKVLQEKLQTGGSLLYTWEGGLGTNFIALISYYAASPLYLLS
ncbi:MAG: YfhO family protein, partial [Clostridia bacterium]|nr:YfhO family protein [Clostridia bacterium]